MDYFSGEGGLWGVSLLNRFVGLGVVRGGLV